MTQQYLVRQRPPMGRRLRSGHSVRGLTGEHARGGRRYAAGGVSPSKIDSAVGNCSSASSSSPVARSPRVWRSASSGLRATFTVTAMDTSGMQHDPHLGQAERLDRMVEHDLRAVDGQAARGAALGDVAIGHRAVQAAGLARLADDDDGQAGDPLGDPLGLLAARGSAPRAAPSGSRSMCGSPCCRAQRFLLRQQDSCGRNQVSP